MSDAGAGAATELGGVAGWAVDLMDRLGAAGAGVAIAAENLFPPLPSEVILPLAGFAASQGRFSLGSAVAWTTAGSVVGALALYVLGAWLGRDRAYALWAKVPLTQVSDLERTEAWFVRHGGKAVLLGRFLPIFRSLISIPAGLTRMGMARFVLLTTVGSAIWNTVFIVAGYQLGVHWERAEPIVGWLQWGVIAAVVAAVAVYVVGRLRLRPA